MIIESAVFAVGGFLVLLLAWQMRVIRKRLGEVQNEVRELHNSVSRLFVMALNAGSVGKPAATETSGETSPTIAAAECSCATEPDTHTLRLELEAELAQVDGLCANLITLAPPKEALPLLSKQEAERSSREARERLRPWPLQK